MNLVQSFLSLVEKAETAPSLKAPSEWWDKMVKDIKKSSPTYDDERIRQTIGSIWYSLSIEKRKEIRARYGKTYGPAPKESLVEDLLSPRISTLLTR